MDHEIDARGLACPRPIMRTSKALSKINKERLIVIVNDAATQENVHTPLRRK